jgi:hypothetical protein
MTTITNIKAGLLVACIVAVSAPGIAAALSAGDTVGIVEADIRAALEAEGYNVGDIAIEVEATRDGKEYEIEVSLETGQVLEIELEDDDDD